MKPTTTKQKVVRGISEGSVITAITEISVDATVQLAPWFTSRRLHLAIILGAIIGGAVRWLASKFVWYKP